VVLPYIVHAWSRHSRRIYHMSRESQALLNVTSVRTLRWSDIGFPFDSFAITLSQPLRTSGEEYDCLIVSVERYNDGQTALRVQALPSRLARYKPLDRFERPRFEKAVHQHEWDRLGTMAQRFSANENIPNPVFIRYAFRPDDLVRNAYRPGQTMSGVVEGVGEGENLQVSQVPLFETIIRLIIGMSLYVTTRPAGISPTTEWERPPSIPGGPPNVVSDGALTCIVQTAFKLDPAEVRVYENAGTLPHAGIEKNPHFRCGFWRRPRGQAKNPLALKTIWVKPTIVRADRLPPGTLPRGSQAKVV